MLSMAGGGGGGGGIAPVLSLGPSVCRPPRRRLSPRVVVVGAWLGMVALAVLPLLVVSVPPLAQEFYNLARIKILVDPGAPYIRDFFEVHWDLIPDLAMDLIVPGLARLTSVEFASTLFWAATLVLLASGTLVLHRAIHGAASWSPAWPLLSGLFLYNWVVYLGYANFLFATGLMLWAVAAWVALAGRRVLVRSATGAAFALPLYIAHLFPLGVFGLVVATRELTAWRLEPGRRSPRRLVARAAGAAAPFVLPMALLIVSSTAAGHIDDFAFEWGAKPRLLLSLLMTGDPPLDSIMLAALCAAAAVALWRGWVWLPPAWRPAFAVLGLAFVLLPTRALGSDSIGLRLALSAVFLGIAATRPVPMDRRAQRYVAVALGCLFLARIGHTVHEWRGAEETLNAYRAGFARLAPGSVLFSYQQDRDNAYSYPYHRPRRPGPPLWSFGPAQEKAVALALLEQPVLAPKTYLVRGHQPVVYAPAYEPVHRLQLQAQTGAERRDFTVWLKHLHASCPDLPRLFTAVYVAVHDPERRLWPPPHGARLVFERPEMYVIALDRWTAEPPPPATRGCTAAEE